MVKKQKKPAKTKEKEQLAVILKPHQLAAEGAFNAGKRNQYLIWHRRAGKDWYGMDRAAKVARREVGTYWHLLPKHIQAKRAIWNGIDHNTGKRFLELFFPDAVAINNTEMFLELECGSTWQLLGSDNYDRMVGSNPRGVVYSEWALCDPKSREYINPILRANKGWNIYITTFRGRNHAYQMYNNLVGNPDWYVDLKTIRDTGIITLEDVEAERREGTSERLIRQEYFCEPAPPASLGQYARVFDDLEANGAVVELPAIAKTNTQEYLSVGIVGDYRASILCSVRGNRRYIHGGEVMYKAALHELIKEQHSAIARGRTIITGSEEIRQDASQLELEPEINKLIDVDASTFLESCVLSPTSLLVSALTGAIGVKLEEDSDEEAATHAVFAALEQLAQCLDGDSQAWGKRQDYTAHDRAVI